MSLAQSLAIAAAALVMSHASSGPSQPLRAVTERAVAITERAQRAIERTALRIEACLDRTSA